MAPASHAARCNVGDSSAGHITVKSTTSQMLLWFLHVSEV